MIILLISDFEHDMTLACMFNSIGGEGFEIDRSTDAPYGEIAEVKAIEKEIQVGIYL